MSDPKDYGRYYWCAKVHKDVAPGGEIYVFADYVSVPCTGALIFARAREGQQDSVNLALGPGKWLAVYAASVLDGSAVAVEHWKGEVER